MRKIQRQLSSSINTPPASGPVSEAIPAAAPHRPIAAPRCAGGNICVISAIVCGVSSAAPSPCTTRAMISMLNDGANPHASDANTKITRPAT